MKIKSLQQNKTIRQDKKKKANSRINALATLPVFYKLQNKEVLIAGGTDAAAWKAELLAAAGAHVHVYALKISQIFADIIQSTHSRGSMTWHKRSWTADSFSNMQIAICDAQTEGEAKAFYCAAKAAGVAVNVIDRPHFCEFQFGSIVNRSPAVISISTDGAAPILGQAIRRRIETLITPSVAQWVKLAQKIRRPINEILDLGTPRRIFWEHFVDRTFMGEPAKNEVSKLIENAKCIARSKSKNGKVTLVGAGPGDAELLTLKAVRALQMADIILFDDLVSLDVLELARREAKRMLVGKRGGQVSCKQDDINKTMVKLAKAGKNVVRLKGGDPMIFGRAGEEIMRLKQENIEVNIVPGITAASAMASQLGISLTHRDHAQLVQFVTGHARNGKLPTDLNWKTIAATHTTTVFYMGGRTAPQIAEKLIDHGLSKETPTLVAKSVGRKSFRHWNGTLSDLAACMNEIGYDEPVLIAIGLVFAANNMQNLNQEESIIDQDKMATE